MGDEANLVLIKTMKICIAGKNNIAISGAAFLLTNNLVESSDLFVLFNQSDTGVDSFQKSFKKFCLEEKLRQTSLEEVYSIKDLILISLEFDRIIAVNKFASRRLYNIHFSLLPKYKGMYTSSLPILHGENYSGVTLHEIDDGIDTGDIIDQIKFEIGDEDTARDLYFKYIHFGIKLFKQNIEKLLSGSFSKTPQPALGSTYYSKKSIDYSNLEIDLRKTAFEVRNQIRAFCFKEYQIPQVEGFAVSSAKILNIKSTQKPGTVVNETKNYIEIATVDYNLRLCKQL